MTTIVVVAVTTFTSSIINKVYYYLFITQDGNNLVVKLKISKISMQRLITNKGLLGNYAVRTCAKKIKTIHHTN